MEYIVLRPEIHLSKVKVEANSPEEAFAKVVNMDDDAKEIATVYDETMEPCERTWCVTDGEGNFWAYDEWSDEDEEDEE